MTNACNSFFDEVAAKTQVQSVKTLEQPMLRAAHITHSFSDYIVMGSTPVHTLVYAMGGTAPVNRFYDGKHDFQLSRFNRISSLMPAFRAPGWQCDGSSEVLHYYIQDDVLREHITTTHDIDPANVEFIDRIGVPDDFMRRVVPMILQQLQQPEPTTELMLDGFEQLIAAHLIRAHSTVQQHILLRPDPAALDPQTLRKVDQLMQDRLEDKLSLDDFADLTGMSKFHFARAFKAATGDTPHQALISLRIARATFMLRTSMEPISSVAYSCGFSSQSHMTTAFAKYVGATPAVYRASTRT